MNILQHIRLGLFGQTFVFLKILEVQSDGAKTQFSVDQSHFITDGKTTLTTFAGDYVSIPGTHQVSKLVFYAQSTGVVISGRCTHRTKHRVNTTII